MEKIDYKKDYKKFYIPKQSPEIIEIPQMNFATIKGEGDPNEEPFASRTEALYSLSYAVKMSYKSENPPEGYYPYVVFPLEGVWDLVDKEKGNLDKANYAYKIMIRQPDFLTKALFDTFVEQIKKKKSNGYINDLGYECIEDGLCCQMLHVGSFDTEIETFEKMEQFVISKGYKRLSKLHREIYLSDPRKTAPEKLKTVLRFKVQAVGI